MLEALQKRLQRPIELEARLSRSRLSVGTAICRLGAKSGQKVGAKDLNVAVPRAQLRTENALLSVAPSCRQCDGQLR